MIAAVRCGLAVIDVTDRADVEVGFCPIKLFLSHRNPPETEIESISFLPPTPRSSVRDRLNHYRSDSKIFSTFEREMISSAIFSGTSS